MLASVSRLNTRSLVSVRSASAGCPARVAPRRLPRLIPLGRAVFEMLYTGNPLARRKPCVLALSTMLFPSIS